jgi:hypothetical protein
MSEWLKNHLIHQDHCQHFRCVSVWWYYDQLVRDTPGYIYDFQLPRDQTGYQSNRRPNFQQDPNRPSNKFNRLQPHQSTDSTWTPIQLNLADEAETQRPIMINRTAPEPHEELLDTEEWETFYDDKMPEDQNKIMKDLLFEIKQIKGGNATTNKHYRDTRSKTIEAAAAAYEKDRNSPQIPDYLLPIKTPWSSGYGRQQCLRSTHDMIQNHLNHVEQMRNTNATLYQMEITSQRHGPPCWSRRILSTDN